MDKLWGYSSNGLQVKVGDRLCSTIDVDVPMTLNGAWVTLECEDYGIVGRNIRLENDIPFMVICGIQVFGYYMDIDEDALPG